MKIETEDNPSASSGLHSAQYFGCGCAAIASTPFVIPTERQRPRNLLDQQNIGPQIVAWLDESATPISAFHQIDSNHFGDRPQGWDNGFEAIRLTEGTGYTYADNIAFGAALGISSRPGISEVDPQLVQDPDGLWRPSGTSPAIDGATTSALFSEDMDGQARIGLFDIGADEVSVAQIVRKPLTADDVGASWFNYEPPDEWPLPPQLPPGEFLIIEAEDFTAITDPDSDGDIWTVANVVDASGGAAIKAPDGSRTNLPGPHETLALYDISFGQEGDYTAYYHSRGFDGSSDSFFTPDDFGVDPDVTENVSSNGDFRWENGGEFAITSSNVGMPLEFRLGRREGDTEIDVILFHQNGGLTSNQLDAILMSLPGPGDFDGNGVVNGLDFLAWQRNPSIGSLSDWETNYGMTAQTAATAVVPEPRGVLLLLLAVGLLSPSLRRLS